LASYRFTNISRTRFVVNEALPNMRENIDNIIKIIGIRLVLLAFKKGDDPSPRYPNRLDIA
jgi:hypothetical protein